MADNNENNKPVVRKTWVMLKKAIPEYAKGMTRHFTGSTAPVDNKWYDEINNVAISLASNSSYDADKKLYSIKQGSNGEVYQTGIASTTEYVFRHMKGIRCTYYSGGWAEFVRPGDMNNNGSFQLLKVCDNASSFAFLWSSGGAGTISTYIRKKPAELGLVDNALTTVTYTSKGLYINGQFIGSWGKSLVNRKSNLRFGGGSTFGSDGIKVHDVRFYPFDLTDEEIAANHAADKARYGA